MTMNNKDKAGAKAANTSGDSDDALQHELKREQQEPKDAIDDIAKDTNLSGSSSWTTLPPDGKATPGSKK